ncbi:mucin-like protein [Lymantria xylina nucleopolyhedrovirus]|uniref:Mucin-like protein n=1 Tax=Lymantria xylina multiple nucleopolyhedrovirus TaxID=2847840 RepID=D4N241_9ABAC|nr:mucin-like protein [Lymantria xylina nucleopolyhedrovirus]ADD73713.1 mucin-like protein [Lymantria xylina nucleopolyhedrovirus]
MEGLNGSCKDPEWKQIRFHYNEIVKEVYIYISLYKRKNSNVLTVLEDTRDIKFVRVNFLQYRLCNGVADEVFKHMKEHCSGEMKKRLEHYLTQFVRLNVLEHVRFCMEEHVRYYKTVINDKEVHQLRNYIDTVIKSKTDMKGQFIKIYKYRKIAKKINREYNTDDPLNSVVQMLNRIEEFVMPVVKNKCSHLLTVCKTLEDELQGYFKEHQLINLLRFCVACKDNYVYTTITGQTLCKTCAINLVMKEMAITKNEIDFDADDSSDEDRLIMSRTKRTLMNEDVIETVDSSALSSDSEKQTQRKRGSDPSASSSDSEQETHPKLERKQSSDPSASSSDSEDEEVPRPPRKSRRRVLSSSDDSTSNASSSSDSDDSNTKNTSGKNIFNCHANPEFEVNTEPAAEPVPEPAAEPVPEPAAEPVPEPAAEPVPEPAAEPVPEPAAEPVPELAAEPVPEPAAEPVPEPAAEPVPEPAAEPVPEPAAEPVPEPAAESTTDKLASKRKYSTLKSFVKPKSTFDKHKKPKPSVAKPIKQKPLSVSDKTKLSVSNKTKLSEPTKPFVNSSETKLLPPAETCPLLAAALARDSFDEKLLKAAVASICEPVASPAPEPVESQLCSILEPVESQLCSILTSEPVARPVPSEPVASPAPEPVESQLCSILEPVESQLRSILISEPVARPVPSEPVAQPAPEPVECQLRSILTSEPVARVAPEPVESQLCSILTSEPVARPAPEPVESQPCLALEQVVQPALEPVELQPCLPLLTSEPIVAPEPVGTQPRSTLISEPVARPVFGSESSTEPVARSAPVETSEPVVRSVHADLDFIPTLDPIILSVKSLESMINPDEELVEDIIVKNEEVEMEEIYVKNENNELCLAEPCEYKQNSSSLLSTSVASEVVDDDVEIVSFPENHTAKLGIFMMNKRKKEDLPSVRKRPRRLQQQFPIQPVQFPMSQFPVAQAYAYTSPFNASSGAHQFHPYQNAPYSLSPYHFPPPHPQQFISPHEHFSRYVYAPTEVSQPNRHYAPPEIQFPDHREVLDDFLNQIDQPDACHADHPDLNM